MVRLALPGSDFETEHACHIGSAIAPEGPVGKDFIVLQNAKADGMPHVSLLDRRYCLYVEFIGSDHNTVDIRLNPRRTRWETFPHLSHVTIVQTDSYHRRRFGIVGD